MFLLVNLFIFTFVVKKNIIDFENRWKVKYTDDYNALYGYVKGKLEENVALNLHLT